MLTVDEPSLACPAFLGWAIYLPQMMILILIAYLDRSNIGNAVVFGFEEGLNLHGHQFNDISSK